LSCTGEVFGRRRVQELPARQRSPCIRADLARRCGQRTPQRGPYLPVGLVPGSPASVAGSTVTVAI
jgi:hypothetical protein